MCTFKVNKMLKTVLQKCFYVHPGYGTTAPNFVAWGGDGGQGGTSSSRGVGGRGQRASGCASCQLTAAEARGWGSSALRKSQGSTSLVQGIKAQTHRQNFWFSVTGVGLESSPCVTLLPCRVREPPWLRAHTVRSIRDLPVQQDFDDLA